MDDTRISQLTYGIEDATATALYNAINPDGKFKTYMYLGMEGRRIPSIWLIDNPPFSNEINWGLADFTSS
jgi:hypothetical protein